MGGTGGPEEQHTEGSCPLLRCWSSHLGLIQDLSAPWHRGAPGAGGVRRRTSLLPLPVWMLGSGFVCSEADLQSWQEKKKSPWLKSSSWMDCLVVPLSPLLLSLLCSECLTLSGVGAPLTVRSSFPFADYSLWPSPLVPPLVLTYSTKKHRGTF